MALTEFGRRISSAIGQAFTVDVFTAAERPAMKRIRPVTDLTRTRASWLAMKYRCTSPKYINWKDYGGRGITFCERWKSFDNFMADMGARPAGFSLERVNCDGNYEPSNCKWIPRENQPKNRRTNRTITYNGKTQCICEWAREIGINHFTLQARFSHGWTAERALLEKVQPKAEQ